jgi:hypothetical protein
MVSSDDISLSFVNAVNSATIGFDSLSCHVLGIWLHRKGNQFQELSSDNQPDD